MTAVSSPGSIDNFDSWTPPVLATGLLNRMADEWRELLLEPRVRDLVATWRDREPIVASWNMARPLNGPNADSVLAALMRLYKAGDDLAGRAIFQAMRPKAIKLARSQRRWMSDEDADSATAAALLMAIRTCARRGTSQRVSRDLGFEALHRLTRLPGRSPEQELVVGIDQTLQVTYRDWSAPDNTSCNLGSTAMAQDDVTDCIDRVDNQRALHAIQSPDAHRSARQRAVGTYPFAAGTVEGELAGVLFAAVEQQIISGEDAELLLAVYGSEETGHRPEVATEFGLSEANLRKRCSRAVKALSQSAHTLVPQAA
jgi:hypothetical protein